MSMDKGFGSSLDKIRPIGTSGLADDSVTDAKMVAHTTTKITIIAKGQLNSAIIYNDQTNVFGDFNQDFKDNRIRIFNPAGDKAFTIIAPAITANWNLTLPLLTSSDIVVTEGFIQPLSNKTLITPTIVSLINMNHDHSNTAGGGSLTNSALNSGVFAAITGLGVQTQALDMDGNDIILDADGDLKLNLATDDVFKLENTTNQVKFSMNRKEVVTDGSFLALIKFQGFNDASSTVTYINIQGVMQSDVAGAESSMIRLCPMENGTLKPYLDIDGKAATVTVIRPLEIAGGIKHTPLSKIFEHYFSGDSVDAIWTQNDIQGTNTFAVVDGIDRGVRITTNTTSSDRGSITFNDIRHFDPALCTIWGILRYDNSENVTRLGVSELADPEVGGNEFVMCQLFSGNTNIALSSGDGTTSSNTESSVVLSTNAVPIKIICNGTNLRLYLLSAGAWVLEVTKTTDRPTTACQPNFSVKTVAANAAIGDALYLRVQND